MARFFTDVSVQTIMAAELVNPFRKIKIFDITGVQGLALTLAQVPQRYRPYKGCLFVS